MTRYREWCSRPNTRRGRMVPVTALPSLIASNDAGYVSVYMFSEADAKKIQESGNSQNFDQYEVSANELVIDIDSGEADLRACTNKLDDYGFGYTVYSSGAKGHHVVLPLDRTYADKRVPYSQRYWVEWVHQIKCDLSVYRPNSLIALEGRVHPKTKKKKVKLFSKPGKPVTLELVSPPETEMKVGDSEESLKIGLAQLYSLLVNAPGDGNRHLSIWKTSKSLCEGGIPFESALEFLQVINSQWPNPKAEEEVVQAVKAAYEKV